MEKQRSHQNISLLFFEKFLRMQEFMPEDSCFILLYPTEKKRVDIELTESLEDEINHIEKNIIKITEAEKPPLPKKIPFCRNCGYKEYCFA